MIIYALKNVSIGRLQEDGTITDVTKLSSDADIAQSISLFSAISSQAEEDKEGKEGWEGRESFSLSSLEDFKMTFSSWLNPLEFIRFKLMFHLWECNLN